MNGKAFSIMTQHEAFKLATYLAADDDDWTYNVAPFDPQRHTSPSGNSVSHLARKIVDAGGGGRRGVYFVVEVYDDDSVFLGPL